jgi:predicted DNA-binding protein
MANSKAISIRIPDELLEKIDLLAEEKYKSHKGTPNRSLVVLDAIVQYFNTLSDTSNFNDTVSVSDNVSIVEFNELREKLIALSDTVDKMKKKMSPASDTVSEVDEKLPEQNQLSIIAVSNSAIEVADNSKSTSDETILTADRLAARLKVELSTLQGKKSKWKDDAGAFLKWSREKDPDGYGWKFEKKYGSPFYRVEPLA